MAASNIITADGSHTIKNEPFDELYHSERGAVMESLHVFIGAGFQQISSSHVNVYEVGFGTGLNALLTLLEAQKTGKTVYYETVELYPISLESASTLNFTQQLGVENGLFLQLHSCPWNEEVAITPYFTVRKIRQDATLYKPLKLFNVVYFDAFSCNTQPELWTEGLFTLIYNSLITSGLLVTYSSKGLVKQALRTAGFTVKRLPGAGGKRHMVRAVKLT
ncbi:MAG: tRNA (5-methylaminomethyl-2-thiouridine)(34)-methyltransferase MnmD [Prevotellaceae bacterium]|jgi:tRNA U34 5-methylaminomethyl-2-thiouridine-forming methyltransferase MnmC|nr:tRNA (5-methylaminomethyl-2-thiouridine)(34)-methyltransferase MnmD [Prevotellaceae bacterium]